MQGSPTESTLLRGWREGGGEVLLVEGLPCAQVQRCRQQPGGGRTVS